MKFKNIKKKIPPAGGKKIQSPSNSRRITESPKLSLPKLDLTKTFKLYDGTLKIFVLLIFLIAVVVVGLDLQNNLEAKKNIDSKRVIINRDLIFWENFIAKNPNFPDAYFQASSLEYRLGDIASAKKYLEKGLFLNPNSENGKKLAELLK